MTPIKLNLKPLFLSLLLGLFLVGCGGAPADNPNYTAPSGEGDIADGSTSSVIKIGSGGGDSFSNGNLKATQVSAGVAQWQIDVVLVDDNNRALVSVYEVDFSSTCVTTGLSSFDSATATTVAGRASVVYTADTCTGIDTVVATLTVGEASISADVDLDIDDITDVVIGDDGGTVHLGVGSGADFVEGELNVSSSSLQAGGTTTIFANLVDGNNELVSGEYDISYQSNCLSENLAFLSASGNFAENKIGGGVARVEYTAEGCSGDDVITARVTVGASSLSATTTVSVEPDEVLGLTFVSADPSQIALSGTGGEETTTVTFQLVGALGAPIVGESVSFELSSSIGGVSLAEGMGSAVSDNEGLVSTVVQAGTVSTSVKVLAVHDATGNQSQSDSIVISSGVPVDSKFSVALSTFGPANAFDTNGVEVEISVIASDMFGNDALNGTQIFFASPETGNIDESCTLQSGECGVTWRSAGVRPADLRATIIAYTTGAEDFTDFNGNNVYDAADSAGNDIAEAYVDEDESGAYESGEFFVDANNNGVRDSGNSLWDGPCLEAVNPVADCSGDDGVVIFKARTIQLPTNTARLVQSEISYDFGATWVDHPAGSTIDTAPSASGISYLRLVVADSNTLADAFGGHSLPSGTTIVASSNVTGGGFSMDGDTSYDVLTNDLSPAVIILTFTDSNAAVDAAVITVKVEVPGGRETNFVWPVNYDSAL